MVKRKMLSKKIRFEVFKRDGFKCQYCGAEAPNVLLHVDHIEPVSKGGTNDILNLVTACLECNFGKGARRLSDDSALKKQGVQLQELAKRSEQIEMMLEWRRGISSANDKLVSYLEGFFSSLVGDGIARYTFPTPVRREIEREVEEFGLEGVEYAFRHSAHLIVTSRLDGAQHISQKSWVDFFSYAKRVTRAQKQNKDKPYIVEIFYLRKIVINNFGSQYAREAFTFYDKLLSAGVEFFELKAATSKAYCITDWRNEMERIVKKHGVDRG